MASKIIELPHTEEQKTFLEELLRLKKKLKKAKAKYEEFKKDCKHSIAYNHCETFGDGSAWCSVCGEHFGWYCPDSPDHGCHYDSYQGMVELSDGTKVPVPKYHDADYETDDDCIFCHQPNERK